MYSLVHQSPALSPEVTLSGLPEHLPPPLLLLALTSPCLNAHTTFVGRPPRSSRSHEPGDRVLGEVCRRRVRVPVQRPASPHPPALRRLMHALRMRCTLVHTLSPSLLRRHVILPKHIAKTAPKGRLLTDTEWRGIGVQQSRGWVHYSIHRCPPPAGSPLPCVTRHLSHAQSPASQPPLPLSHEPPGRTL